MGALMGAFDGAILFLATSYFTTYVKMDMM